MPVRRLSLIVASAALLAAPAGADAATYCVEKPACAGLDMTLQGALDEAAATAADDRVEIGAVTLAPAAYSYAPAIDAGAFVLLGAGRTQTLLQNAPASEQPALRVIRGPGGNPMRVASLGVRLSTAPGAFAYGVRTGAVLEDVDVATPAPMAGTMLGVDLLNNAVMRDSAVTLQATGNDPTQRVGVFASENGVLVERSAIDAPHALYAQGNLRVARTRVRARGDVVRGPRHRGHRPVEGRPVGLQGRHQASAPAVRTQRQDPLGRGQRRRGERPGCRQTQRVARGGQHEAQAVHAGGPQLGDRRLQGELVAPEVDDPVGVVVRGDLPDQLRESRLTGQPGVAPCGQQGTARRGPHLVRHGDRG